MRQAPRSVPSGSQNASALVEAKRDRLAHVFHVS
jgi:hypothetical protein